MQWIGCWTACGIVLFMADYGESFMILTWIISVGVCWRTCFYSLQYNNCLLVNVYL